MMPDRRVGPLTRRQYSVLLMAALAVVVFVIVFFFALRLRMVYRHGNEIAVLQQELQALSKAQEAKDAAYRAELNSIIRTLYDNMADVESTKKVATDRRPSSVELWQRTRDAALQKRLKALEDWRYRNER